MSLTKQRTFHYIVLILIFAGMAAGYWYWQAKAGSKLSAPQTGMLTNGLVGYWTFDGNHVSGTTVTDQGSTGVNGTLNNGPVAVGGRVGQAMNFDGTNDYMRANNSYQHTNVSVSAWFKSDDTAGQNTIFSKYFSNNDGWWVRVESGVLEIVDDIDNASDNSCPFPETIQTNVWYHVVAEIDNLSQRIFVNGVEIRCTDTVTASWDSYAGSFFVGSTESSPQDPFNGTIDEVRLYNRALSLSEVQSLYAFGQSDTINSAAVSSQGTGRLDSNLYGYWKLDEGSGTSAADSSVNAFTAGTLANGPTWNTGQIGSAVTFDGTDDYVDLGTVGMTSQSQFTLSAWIHPTTLLGSTTYAIASNRTAGNAGFSWQILSCSGSAPNIVCNLQFTIQGVASYTTTADPIREDEWQHVALVFGDAAVKFYYNGSFIESIATGSMTTGTNLLLGRAGNSTNYFIGHLDEFRIYDRMLAGDEIYRLSRLTTPTTPDTTLKGYWSFDGSTVLGTTAYDLSGVRNTGTLTNGPTTTFGQSGQAIDFDGTDDYVTMADNAALDIGDTDDLTLTGWFSRDTFTADDTIIAKINGITASEPGYIAYLDDSSDKLVFLVCDSLSSCDTYTLTSETAFTSTGWNHFAIVWDQDSASGSEIYINGLANGASDAGTIGNVGDLSNALSFRIGSESDAGNPFDGKIDEIRVYRRTLSAAEIKGLYDTAASDKKNTSASTPQGTGRLDSGLIGYWALDASSGTSAADSSTNGNSGTLTNMEDPGDWTTGQIGNGLTFDGVDEYVTGSTVSLDAPVTLCSWYKINATSDIFDNTAAVDTAATLRSSAANYEAFSIGIRNNGNDFAVVGAYALDNTGGSYSRADGTTNLWSRAGEWVHICGTFASSTLRTVYFNGFAEGTNSGSENAQASSLLIGAGTSSSALGHYAKGVVDDVRAYNRVLSDDEIRQLYRLTSPTGTETSLKGYWSFNGQDIAGTTAYDRSGTGNNGTLINTPTKTFGRLGQAINFDGGTDYVDHTDIAFSGTFTFSTWFKTSDSSQTGIIFGEDSGNTGSTPKIGLASGDFFVRLVSTSDTTVSVPTDGNWHLLTLTRDASDKVDLYIDGGSANRLFSDSAQSGTYTLDKLGVNGTVNQPFLGSLDEVRVYNRTLSASEIAALYNQGR